MKFGVNPISWLWVAMSITSLLLPLMLMFQFLPIKDSIAVDWFDIVTEGALFVVSFCWLLVVYSARPKGNVTSLLLVGLSFYTFGCYLDILDEIFIRNDLGIALNIIEKLPTPLGLTILTYGLWQWRLEQRVINQQLHNREQFIRQHYLVDPLTQLNDIRGFEVHLKHSLDKGSKFGLVMFDLDNFTEFNQTHGMANGDKFLNEVSHWLSYRARNCDLICRYAGDRFIAMIDSSDDYFVPILAQEITESLTAQKIQVSSSWMLPTEIQSVTNNQCFEDEIMLFRLIGVLNQKMETIKFSNTAVNKWKLQC
ncbi:GGDEF domain-containing protein [Parashewanella curva]|uniref:GGDEF domain-containing protein n=1 Tax=Parashewanella curva TaxID=2338552 RepID=A0A3L8Q0S8_9GAMM|nr:GGDEF domain-containing protein [Parashewanella curva]RLV61184.1 GGDEF domain-containing protein [Parashewanella curva]